MQSGPAYNPVEEAAKGKANAVKVMDEGCDVGAAFRHPTLGYISLLYGDREKGVRHIRQRREREIADDARLAGQVPRDVVLKLIDVIIFGKMVRIGPKYHVEHEGYRAVLASPLGEQMNYWLLTGFKIT
jgi:hypothetical protein